MAETVPLSILLDTLLQKAYTDLTILQDILPRKSDGDRKLEIVQYARRTRSLVIRLLALVKWVGNSKSLDKCSEMSTLLRDQQGLYVNTADQLAHLSRNVLVQACTPNFTLAPAVDVLTTGSYPRLPTCVRDKIVPLPPLTADQSQEAFYLIDCAIRCRLLVEQIPLSMKVKSIGQGVVTFMVPCEFEISLSVVGDDVTLPWRLVSMNILVGSSLPGSPVLVHEFQKVYLHQLIQSRLCADSAPLLDAYQCLHSFCLSLQLDCLHSQANRLGSDLFGGHVKVEEYRHGDHLKLVYWRPSSSGQLLSTILLNSARGSSPRLTITIHPTREDNPFSLVHTPPLPEGSKVDISVSNLSLEALLEGCVSLRSHTLLSTLRNSLTSTIWAKHAVLSRSPLSLTVTLSLKYWKREVVLGVDGRVGQIILSLQPPCLVEGVASRLEEIRRTLTTSKNDLPSQLGLLQRQLFLDLIYESATESGYKVQRFLPLLKPLPLPASEMVYIELQPRTFLGVSMGEALEDHYYLLTLDPVPADVVGEDWPAPPSLFLQPSSVLELDPEQIYTQHLRKVFVRERGVVLKRKLQQAELDLPSKKRLCLYHTPLFSPLPAVLDTRMTLVNMEASLRNASIIPHHPSVNGSPSLHIFEFPMEVMVSQDVHELLSSHLQFCRVSPSSDGYTCTFVFSGLPDIAGSSSETVLHQTLPSGCDLGMGLQGIWRARLMLLGLTLELLAYLKDNDCPLAKHCSINSYTFERLSVSFNKHSMDVFGTSKSLHLSFSELCPHATLREQLEGFLVTTHSLPLLLKGLCATESAMDTLTGFVKSMPGTTLSALSPPHVQLKYNHLTLSLTLQEDSSVVFTDLTYNRLTSVLANSPPITPLTFLKVFLQATLRDVSMETDETTSSFSATSTIKPTLLPIPSPITHPRPSVWGAPSPRELSIPSIPPLGSYSSPGLSRGNVSSNFGGWSFTTTLEELQALCSEENEGGSLKKFMGSMSLFLYFIVFASKSISGQLQFVQCDSGTCTYRSDNLTLQLSMDGDTLKLTPRPARENVWVQSEMDTLAAFFQKEVVTKPFVVNAMVSFIGLLKFPLPSLKSFVQILQMHMNPPSGAVWRLRVCLILPENSSLRNTPFVAGHQGIILSKKLVIFFELIRNEDGFKLLLPIVHDPVKNETFVTKSQNAYLHPAHQYVDNILRKTVADSQSPGITSSLSLALSVLCKSTLPKEATPTPNVT
ncbi:mediator of RNA polymerase II transcription subunit 14-like isoform X2 [Halichondria panicea]|uniref:mediator of RNA polymerase II transcription subunit 14-like isoform X2 n=1 Tax=Halichondria panicea TaxID=6063 RepID=UPI00312BAC1E